MAFVSRLFLAWMVGVTSTSSAIAGDWTIGVETAFDRDPRDFSEPKATKIQVNAERTFANGAALGGSFQPQIKADSGEVSYNLEVTFGYTWKVTRVGSVGGSAGIGEKFQQESSGGNFPYYVLRVRADIDLSERWSWNVITYRFRDAFDTANDYNTPEVSSGISLKIDDRRSVYAKYYFGWKDGSPDYQGIGFGYRHRF
jgi:hypothetical protein